MRSFKKSFIALSLLMLVSIVLYACSSKSYTLTFNTNGGSLIESKSYLKDEIPTRPSDPSKLDYKFDDWYDDTELTQKFKFEKPLNSDTTIYAGWIKNAVVDKVSITFNSNGGTSITNLEGNKGSSFTKPTDPTKDGYNFIGWYMEEGLPNIYTFGEPLNQSITLYAKWEVIEQTIEVTITFDSIGGSDVLPLTGEMGSIFEEPGEPTKVGSIFKGWYLLDELFDFTNAIDESITLIAKWEVQSNEVEISTVGEFVNLINNGGSKYYKLVADLDFTGIDLTSSNSTFTGVLDGNGKTISNIDAKAKSNKEGVFFKYVLNGAEIKDLTIRDSHFLGKGEGTGFITTYAYGGAIFNNLTFLNVGVSSTGSYTSLIYADNDKNTDVDVPVIVNGIVVINNNDYAISGGDYTGGLVGHIRARGDVNISNLYFYSKVTSKNGAGQVAGAMIGRIQGSSTIVNVDNVVVKGEISASKNVAPIIGTSVVGVLNAKNVFVSNYTGTVTEGNKNNILVGNVNGMTINSEKIFYVKKTTVILDVSGSSSISQGTEILKESVTQEFFGEQGFSKTYFEVKNNDLFAKLDLGPVEYTGFSVITNGVKLDYLIGEELDLTNLVVKANYSDGTSVELEKSDYIINAERFNKAVIGDYPIYVTYKEDEREFNVRVIDIESIEVQTLDVDTLFLLGESLNTNKIFVKANLTNGESFNISDDEYFITNDYNEDVTGEYKITITYKTIYVDSYFVTVTSNDELPIIHVNKDFEGIDGSDENSVKTFKTIKNALRYFEKIKLSDATEKVIYISNGVYEEKLTINTPKLTLIGESRKGTVLTYHAAAGHSKPDGSDWGTQGSASVSVKGSAVNFMATNLTFENSYDYNNNDGLSSKQGVALVNEADQAIYYQVDFIGMQDTLYAKNGRQYYLDVYIEGVVDFIFGNGGPAFFEDSEIKSMNRGTGVIATNKGIENGGALYDVSYVFYNNRFTSEEGTPLNSVDLGRPWGKDAGIMYINNVFGDHITKRGWTDMSGNSPLDAKFFEYGNKDVLGNVLETTSNGKTLTEDGAKKYQNKDNVFAVKNGDYTFKIEWNYSEDLARLSSYLN